MRNLRNHKLYVKKYQIGSNDSLHDITRGKIDFRNNVLILIDVDNI